MGSNLNQWRETSTRKKWLTPAAILLIIVVLLLATLALQNGGLLFPKQDETWAAIEQRGQWRIGVDPSFPPFEFLDEDGKPVGFDLELANEIAAQWGVEVPGGVEVQVVAIGFDSLIDAVQTEQVDSVISALPYDPRLTKDLLYSIPYFDAGISVAVRTDSPLLTNEEAAVFTTPEDASRFLSGKRVGVEWGGMGDMLGRRYQREVEGIELVPFETPQETVNALQQDPALDAILVDNITLHQMQQSASIVGIGPILESNPYVIASPIEATMLSQKIDAALEKLHQDGIIHRLTQKWF